MFRHVVARPLLVTAVLCVAGCAWDRPPRLSKREESIIQRRQSYGKETVIGRDRWQYHSKDGQWQRLPDGQPSYLR